MATINLIMAKAKNGVIGYHGSMPWHLPEDLARFRELTNGHPVIMGRKTWDSLPARFRPLPHRRNIVLTRQVHWGKEYGNSLVIKANSVESAMSPQITGAGVKDIWVIGGGQVYALYLPYASRIEITEIQENFKGDTLAPVLGPEWQESKRTRNTSSAGIQFDFVTYINTKPLP